MADLLHQKKLYLDYSNHLELCISSTPEQPPALAEHSVGTGLCTLLNIGLPRLQRLRAHLSQMMPLTTQDPDAYAIMISIKLGNVPLPDSEFAAKLFSLLDTIADLGDVFYLAMQMDKLLNLFEEGAPEKTILKQLAATAARTAAALDTAIVELPLYQKRVDAIFNYTEFDRAGITEAAPLLSRALAYQQQSSDAVLQFKNAVTYRLFAREEDRLTELFPETAVSQITSGLFYGDLLAQLPFSDLVRLMFQQMLLSDTVIRVCGVCGRYFVPTVRSNEKYCDFVSTDADGTALSCKQRSTKARLETDTSLKLLKGAYDKNFIKSGRKKDPDYRTKVFRPWYQWAKDQRALYLDGEIDLETLTERLRRDMDTYLEEPAPAAPAYIASPAAPQEADAEPDETAVADEEAPADVQEADAEPDEPADADEETPVDTQEVPAEPDETADAEEETPVDTQEVPSEPDETADADEEAPADAQEAPAEPDETADADEEAPADAQEVPAEPDETADADEEAPADAQEVPAEPDETADADEETPADAQEVPAEPDETADADEEAPADTQEADAEPDETADAEEETPVDTQEADAEPDETADADEEAPADTQEVPAEPDEPADADEDDRPTGVIDDDPDAVTQSYLEDPPEEPETPAGRSRWKFPWFGQ